MRMFGFRCFGGLLSIFAAIAGFETSGTAANPQPSVLDRYTPRGMLESSKPPVVAPISVRETTWISVPPEVEIGDFDSFFAWFVPTFSAILPTDGEQPLRQGWQSRGSHVRIYRDRIEIDAPMAPGIGSRVMRLCRMAVPITAPEMRGVIVDAGSPGHYITQGFSNCEAYADAYRKDALDQAVAKTMGGHSARTLTAVTPIGTARKWRGQLVLSAQFALEYGLIAPLRLARPGEDPVVIALDPVDYAVIRTIDPLISHLFYNDGRIASVVTYGLPDAATSNKLMIGCVVTSARDDMMLDRDPAVLSWCKAQVDAALPAVDRIIAASARQSAPASLPVRP
jgi:hypothetical protein